MKINYCVVDLDSNMLVHRDLPSFFDAITLAKRYGNNIVARNYIGDAFSYPTDWATSEFFNVTEDEL